MAKSKSIIEQKPIEEVKEPIQEVEEPIEEITVIGIAQAEKYQKGGWQLIDCHLTSKGKQYLFRKGKK